MFTPTPEQQAIVQAACETTDNLLISALAGAAKTSTLILVAEALPETEMLCLAFNKRIADEMKTRLPRNCTAMTLNGLGHRVWGEAIGRCLTINTSKTYDILTEVMGEYPRSDTKDLEFVELMRTIDFGKACGYIPTGTYERGKPLMNDDDFFDHLDEQLTDIEYQIIRESTIRSLKRAFDGDCDFGDQILMPTIFHGVFPRYPLVLVDESQDLSALNHRMLQKLAKRRLIAVGDQCQAIYGFRGAHEDGMAKLREDFNMKELILSVSFRCPQKIVEHARWRAPHMQWPEWAKPGDVRTLSSWTADELPDNAAVICRNNAPLFSCAIKLLKNGRYAEMKNDIGKGLLKIMKKFGPSHLPKSAVYEAIDGWLEKQKGKSKKRAYSGLEDRALCMRIFADQGENLGDAIAYAEHLFNCRGPLKLMTGHGSKGLEFDHVYFLDEFLVKDDGQDKNLRYVIQTRAKETLTYIKMEDFHDA